MKRKYCLHLKSKKKPQKTVQINCQDLILRKCKISFPFVRKKVTLTLVLFRRVSLLSGSYCQPVEKMKQCISFLFFDCIIHWFQYIWDFFEMWKIVKNHLSNHLSQTCLLMPFDLVNSIRMGTLFIMKQTSTQTFATDLISDVPEWAQLPPTFVLSTLCLLIP